jgi:hypothetical protein
MAFPFLCVIFIRFEDKQESVPFELSTHAEEE